MYPIESPLQTTILDVPIARVKFVCHDKHDANTFAAVIQQPPGEDATLPFKIYCFQAEMKIVSRLSSELPVTVDSLLI